MACLQTYYKLWDFYVCRRQFKIEQGPIKIEVSVRPTGKLVDFLLLKKFVIDNINHII